MTSLNIINKKISIPAPVFLTYWFCSKKEKKELCMIKTKTHIREKVKADSFLFDAEKKKYFLCVEDAAELPVTFDNTMCVNVLNDEI